MNSIDGENGISLQGTTTPAYGTPASKDSLVSNYSDKVKMMNSTPNGYSSVPNHKIKSDGHSHHRKHDEVKNHSESSKHNSVHLEKRDGEFKHKEKHSSNSKSKDSTKVHSDKSESTKLKEHSHSKEKKHHSSSGKTKDDSGKNVDHSKHSNNIKKESEKIKSSDKTKKEPKNSEEKSKSEGLKDFKVKEEKTEKEKHKDKNKEKHKELKDRTLEGHKAKLNDKSRDKMKEKHKEISDKTSDFKDNKKGYADEHKYSPIKIKIEAVVTAKIKDEPLSEDDVPLSARKPIKEPKIKIKREKSSEEESDDEPLSSRAQKVKKVKTESSSHKRKADDEDYSIKKPAKKIKKEKDVKKIKQEVVTGSPKKRGKQKEEQDVWKWWEEEKHAEGVKWRTLEHLGPVFVPLYDRVPKTVKFYYNGNHMELSEPTEEVAGFYGKMLDHEYTTKEIFNKNFFRDWRKVMTPAEKEVITDLSKCNFNDFNDYYKMKSEERRNMTKEEKLAIKKENEELTQTYGFCVIDGHRQKIGNFKIEPPGLFRGRGEHPKMGMLKRRVQAEDIIINIGKEAPVPKPPEGHKWKEVRHDNTVTWLVSWNENILGSTKYIMLNPSSKLKGEKDWQKYETARKLKNHADRIRKTYTDDFRSKEMKVRQRAVALYFIDKLALRAGNEKDEETADTVGCCSLRVEHITLDEEKNGHEYVVSFDFLGKDSIRYVNSVAVEKRAFKNLKLFMENKQPGDDLFDRLNTGILNKYLNELMEGLTAKVFRTYNASKTLQEQLDTLTEEEMSLPEKILAYNRANRAVAILCNHQRSVPKGFSKSMEILKNKMDEKMQQIKEFKKEFKKIKQAYKDSNASKDKIVLDKKKKRLQQLEEQLKRLEVQALDKEENKQIALGTSKLNYLDPRISVAWCKKWDVPIEKIYNRTQRDKFRWAIEMAGPEFKF